MFFWYHYHWLSTRKFWVNFMLAFTVWLICSIWFGDKMHLVHHYTLLVISFVNNGETAARDCARVYGREWHVRAFGLCWIVCGQLAFKSMFAEFMFCVCVRKTGCTELGRRNVVTRLCAGVSGVRFLAVTEIFFFSVSSKWALGPTLPPTQWLQQGLDVEPSHTSFTKVNNEGWYISVPPMCYCGLHRDKFTAYRWSNSVITSVFVTCPWCYTFNGKAIPLQAWSGPEGSGRLRLPDFKTISTWRW